MLVELHVSDLGVIEDQTILLGPGLTALTGETGAGKTLLVDAISLLTGGPADPALVAPGAAEARIEGRFESDPGQGPDLAGLDPDAGAGSGSGSGEGEPAGVEEAGPAEVVLTRVIPAAGRSRSYLNGKMISLAQLTQIGRQLVDIHGQHTHQSLLVPSRQRDALDRAAAIDSAEVDSARRRVRELSQARDQLGGDPHDRARQIDLLTYQLAELDGAGLDDPDEDRRLVEEEELLADATGLVETASAAWEALAGEDGIVDRLGTLVSAVSTRRPLAELHTRLAGAQEDLADVAAEARRLAESVEEDPERLARIGERRRVLTELRRKYGTSLGEVIAYREELRIQIEGLASHDRRAAEVDAEMDRAAAELAAAATRLWEARRAAAPGLARQVETALRTLAMPRARFDIQVGPEPGDESVTWLLGANPGQPMLPLAKAASGGELARAMLATRLVMGAGRPTGLGSDDGEPGAGRGPSPATLVFDEVDAGIGGEAAIAVGQALAALGQSHQVLVVTHLAQVAAFASSHLSVAKEIIATPGTGGTGDTGGSERTVAKAHPTLGEARVVELARMLSGRPDSESARNHAEELLAAAGPSPGGRNASTNSGRRRR